MIAHLGLKLSSWLPTRVAPLAEAVQNLGIDENLHSKWKLELCDSQTSFQFFGKEPTGNGFTPDDALTQRKRGIKVSEETRKADLACCPQ